MIVTKEAIDRLESVAVELGRRIATLEEELVEQRETATAALSFIRQLGARDDQAGHLARDWLRNR